MKFVEVSAAKEFAYTRFPDPILNMAVNAVLDSAPAAEVVPVVHGRWEQVTEYEDGDEEDYIKCSACGRLRLFETKYCPNCGAKMDGDGNA